MKQVFWVLILFVAGFNYSAMAQAESHEGTESVKYFCLDKIDTSKYIVTTVHLDNGAELFNVFLGDSTFVLFSALPFKDGQNWVPADESKVSENNITANALHDTLISAYKTCSRSYGYNYSPLKRSDIQIAIKRQGKYYIPKTCLTEFFWVISQEVMFPNVTIIGCINPLSPPITTKEYEDRNLKIQGEYSCNTIASTKATGGSALVRPLERPLLFYSGPVKIGSLTGYKFWTFTDWRVTDASNSHRGIDRFVYVPNVGIVAGSYDFWYQHKLTDKAMMENYMNEQVFKPVSINGKAL